MYSLGRVVVGHESVLDIESAAYILSLRVRQTFWEHGSCFDVFDLARYCSFFAAFLCSWNMARQWTEHIVPSTTDSPRTVHHVSFAMRWLFPSEGQSRGAGFLLQRESGWLPRTGRRPPVPVTEGRLLLLFLTSNTNPPVFNMVILSNGPAGMDLHGSMFTKVYNNPKLERLFKLEGGCKV